MPAIQLVGQVGSVCRFELGKVGSMRRERGDEPVEEIDIIVGQSLERLVDREPRRSGRRSG